MSIGPTRRDIVAPHVHDTACYLLTQRDPCTSTALAQKRANPMRTTSTGKIGRDIRPIDTTELARLKPVGSWLLVILLCDGDDLGDLVAWVRKDAARLERLRFYHHERIKPGALLKPWTDAGLGMPRIDSFKDQAGLSARFGQDIVQRIVDDFGPSARRPPL